VAKGRARWHELIKIWERTNSHHQARRDDPRPFGGPGSSRMATPTYAPAVEQRHIPGRGVGLVATRNIAAGECVVRERAVVCGTSAAFADEACARCLSFAAPDGGPLFTCAVCGLGKLCGGDLCAWTGAPHGKVACFTEGCAQGLPAADVERLRFLAHCQDLRFTKTPESFARLAAIDGLCPVIANDGTGIDEREHTAAGRLQPMLQQAVARCLAGSQVAPPNDAARGQDSAEFAFNQFTTATLLSKETKNAFGAMAPRDSVTGDRRVRGGALYNLASRVNHDCFPNTVRFDNFDGTLNDGSQFFNDGFEAMGTTANTFGNASSPDLQHFSNAPDELRLYALDKISAGTEITMSYLPVTEPLARRRRRLRNTFVFDCTCERCALETQWAIADGDRVGNCDEEFQLHSGTYLHFPNPNTVCPYKTDTFLFTI
jgi:hypothetical protein